MANPFLFMEDESSAVSATNDAFSNPFLVEDEDDEAGDFSAENPFSASNPFAFGEPEDDESSSVPTTTAADLFPSDTVTQSGANLFLVEDDGEELQVDATMSFFGTTINEHDGLQYQKPSELNVVNQHGLIDYSNNAYSSEDELRSKKPPRPNPPPSQVTQQLITNLTDHLDQTSTNLLGKLPVTRTPSPISMRDFHSPSPTPDVGDLLDVSEAFATAQQIENNSFVAQPAVVNHQPEPEQKPMRPPPPRPVPPRPTPPRGSLKTSPVTAPTPVHPVTTTTVTQAHQPQHQQEDDLFNFFGTGQQKKPPPKPPAPKTKEDILSLFAAPTQPVQQTQKPDLLSEDIDFSVQAQPQSQTPVAVVQPYEPHQEDFINEAPASIPQAIVEPMIHQPVVENIVVKSQSIPTIEMDLTPDQPVDDDEQPAIIEEVVQSDQSPESGITSGGIPASISGSSFNMQLQEPEQVQEPPTLVIQEPYQEVVVQEDANPFAMKPLTPPEQLQQLQFLQQKSAEFQHQRPTTPDPIVAQPELAPIFGGPLPVSPAKAPPPRPPARGGSVLTSAQPIVQATVVPDVFKSDEFDDFSAKFESKTQPKITGNAFLDSLGQDAPATADAWGDSDAFGGAAVAADDGFGNEEDGFDTWDPPVVPESSPYMNRRLSNGSDEGKDFTVVIRPKGDVDFAIAAPIMGPPPPQRSPYSGSVNSGGEFD